MYGHGAPPPTRSAGTVVIVRVLLAAAGILSCGLLACVPLFRVAILRGRWFDWTAAWVSLPLSIGALAVVGSVPETDVRSDVALALVLILGAGSAAYYLVTDIRMGQAARRLGGYAPPNAQTVQVPYGYPHPAPPVSPYTSTPVPPGPPVAQAYIPNPPMPQTPMPQTPMPQTPVPQPPLSQTPPPQRPAPARIDQVRAELDELSDYLRKHEDPRDGRPEGGR
ncbi:hypothetical protein ACFV5G_19005 [Streptomyces sp. NPDC059766]|uniref:hypothetical protein n=1 Tax=Streptomyces sp. NPDC059766 TaxID=3346940 RepID=UPI00364A8A1F